MDIQDIFAQTPVLVRVGHVVTPEVVAHDVVAQVVEGRVAGWQPAQEVAPEQVGAQRPEWALVAGLVNAHSHAFQRLFRGRTEHLHPDHPDDDFWTWRAHMYEVANTLDPGAMFAAALDVYGEMAATGITHVGEFHYVHHQPDGTPYEDPNIMAHQLIRAAREIGLRITLLRVVYQRGGFGQAAHLHQRRFIDPDLDDALRAIDALRQAYAADPCVTIGLAPHSVRAVGQASMARVAHYARDHGMPLHVHACEQRAEVQQALEAHGKTPIELLHDARVLGPRTTLVHATHLSPRDLDLIATSGAMVCACPSTERNLGDGFLPALELLRRRVRVCLGSDSHANIDLWDEMRLVEYHERLRYERRNVLAGAYGAWHPKPTQAPQRHDTAALLLPMAQSHGTQSLSHDPHEPPAALEDFCVVDTSHWSIRGTHADSLTSDLAFSLKPAAVRATVVAGRIVWCA